MLPSGIEGIIVPTVMNVSDILQTLPTYSIQFSEIYCLLTARHHTPPEAHLTDGHMLRIAQEYASCKLNSVALSTHSTDLHFLQDENQSIEL